MVKRYDYRGESLTLKELAHRSGLPATLIYQRINHYNYSVEAALSRGVAKRGNVTRLRAAAPLLLEALKDLHLTSILVKYQADNSGSTPYTDWSSAVEDLRKVRERAAAAIAAAEGE